MQSFSPGALLSLLLILTGVTTSHAQKPTAGANIASYNQLCRMVRLATAEIVTPSQGTEADDFEIIATIVNLTASDPTTLDDIANHDTKEYSSLPTKSKAKMHCNENTWDLCKKAAAYARDHKANRQLQQWSKAHYSQQTSEKIQELVAGIIATVTEMRKINLLEKAAAVNASLATALLGPTKAKSRIELQTTRHGRAAMCGKTDSTADSTLIAGKFIAADMLCICGQADSDNKQPALCGTFEPAPQVVQAPDADYWNDWEKFKNGCGKPEKLEQNSATLIRSAISSFVTHIRSNAGAVAGKLLSLGKIPTSLTSHCTGLGGEEDAPCLIYKKEAVADPSNGIAWIKKLETAAADLDNLKHSAEKKEQLLNKLHMINSSLATLAIGDSKTTVTDSKPQEDAVSKTLENKKKECEKHKDNKTTCESTGKCKWNGESETKGECKPKDGEGQTNQGAGEGAATTNTETKKCSDKKKDDCKSPDCNWDGKECKDSSILVNKHFALSVVSAAFVALLF